MPHSPQLPAHPESVTEAKKTITHLYQGKFLGDFNTQPDAVHDRMRDALNLQTIRRAALDPEDHKMTRRERHALLSLKNDSSLLQDLKASAKELAINFRHYDHHFGELMKALRDPHSIDDIQRQARGSSGWRNLVSFGTNRANAKKGFASFVAVEQAEEALAILQKAEEYPKSSTEYESLRLKALQQLNSAVFTISNPRMFAPLLQDHQELLANITYAPFEQTLAEQGFIRDDADQPIAADTAGHIIDAVLMMKIGNRIRHITQAIPDSVTELPLSTDVITKLETVTRAFSTIPHHNSQNDLVQELRGARALISGFTHAIIHGQLTPEQQAESLAQLKFYGENLVRTAYQSAYASLAFMDMTTDGGPAQRMEHIAALRGRIADFILLQDHGTDIRTLDYSAGLIQNLQQQIENIRNVSARLVASIEDHHDQLGMSDQDWEKANQWLTEDIGVSLATIRHMRSAQHITSAVQEERMRADTTRDQQAEKTDGTLLGNSDQEGKQVKPTVNIAANPFA